MPRPALTVQIFPYLISVHARLLLKIIRGVIQRGNFIDFVADKFANDHLRFATNTVRQQLIELYKYRISMVDFTIHRFFAIFENGDKLLRCFCAVNVRLERFSFSIKVLRIIFPNFHSLLALQDEIAPFRPNAQKNCFHLPSTSAHALRQGSHFLYGSSSQQLNSRHFGFLYSGEALFP